MKLKFIFVLLIMFIDFTFANVEFNEKKYGKKNMSIYDIKFSVNDGESLSFERFKGKVLLIVNVASQCGFTYQYKDLQELYMNFKDKGFEIIAFPCNQFGNQEPGTNTEIKAFCEKKYNTSFIVADKINVNGSNNHDLYQYFSSLDNKKFNKKISWNFTKFIIDKNGNVIDRFGSLVSPTSKSIVRSIETALKAK